MASTLKNMVGEPEDDKAKEASNLRTKIFVTKGTYLYNEIREIETGEHPFIFFFAKHGFNTSVKFMNCNRARVRPYEFRPYDLVVVQDEKELDQEYFTISEQGVVKVCPEKGKK